MKDNDTYKLANIYDAINGTPYIESTLINEGFKYNDLLLEGLVDVLGQRQASMLVGLVKREIPTSKDNISNQRVEKLAQQILEHIQSTVHNSMVQRTLSQYRDTSAISRALALYRILAEI